MGIIQGGSIIESLRAMGFLLQPEANVYLVDPGVTAFTLQNAIDLCVAGNGDIIVCLPGGQEVLSTVNIDCSGITIIAAHRGLSPFASGEFSAIIAGANFVDGPVAQITAPCTIIGMGFASRDAGALFFSGAACLIGGNADANPFGVHMKNCRFPKWGWDNRIGLAIEGSSDCLIEECSFEGVTSDFEFGIYVQGATQNLTIRRNHFRDCGHAIRFGAFAGPNQGPHCIIQENVVEDGKLLSASSEAHGIVCGNWLETATDQGSYSEDVDTLNGYGLNFCDQHYFE